MKNETESRFTQRVMVSFKRYGSKGMVCPNCDYSLKREYNNYCPECGQKLDWTTVDDYYHISNTVCSRYLRHKKDLCTMYGDCNGSFDCAFAKKYYPDHIGKLTPPEKEEYFRARGYIKGDSI